ncbi:MAG: tetratricopeptide repeat protein [Bacteriovoracaceae bacterium]|nr:tetratricopeptide repeat protein [Bacteriovoracaceae bacterium]
MTMRFVAFKLLTPAIFLLGLFCLNAQSQVLLQEQFQTHLRWNVVLPKEQIVIRNDNNKLLIQTLNIELYNKIAEDLTKASKNNQYIKDIQYKRDNFPSEPATVEVTLADSAIEFFTFYKNDDQKYVVDFWVNEELKTQQQIELVKEVQTAKPVIVTADTSKAKKKVAKKPVMNLEDVANPITSENKEIREKNPGYRDFRYGGTFIWDYTPLIPSMDEDINLNSKIPEYFFPITDSDYEKDEKEAHMQLSINLYRKENWGMLAKSLKLYEDKYKIDSNYEKNQYIKANALLKNNLIDKNTGVNAAADNILNGILESSTNYELRRAINRYMIQSSLNRGDYIKSLELARKLFIDSKAQFDKEMTVHSSRVILHTLAMLKQNEKINEFLEDQYIVKILPKQIGHAYNSYALLIRNDNAEVISLYEKNKKSLISPVHPSILFNTAEAYFRESKYPQAIELFDTFLKDYSHLANVSPFARLRIALSYDLTEEKVDKTIMLYRNALDRSTNPKARFEAKLRYLGVRLARKKELTAEDLEQQVFFEAADDEKNVIDRDLKKLLWQVRLRLFINSGEYKKALTYLSSIPLDSFTPLHRKVFEQDGSEIIFGLIKESFEEENYSKAVKLWETYKDKFDNKTTINPQIHYIVANAYTKLGLQNSFERSIESFKTISEVNIKTFPIWVARDKNIKLENMINELVLENMIAKRLWSNAEQFLGKISKGDRSEINFDYFQGVVSYNKKEYANAANNFESYLINQNKNNRLTSDQLGELLSNYIESLGNSNQVDRMLKTADAILKDLASQSLKSQSLLNAQERIMYLSLETMTSQKNTDQAVVEIRAAEFLDKFKTSSYQSRVRYLYGKSLIKNLKVEQGSEILNSLIKDEAVPSYLREMAKTELSGIKLGVQL